jgi:UDP-N-acetylglucosamine--N-acetylmuramyl-(pentapeptide) pyrophosphoryl-undecaprenol N-acetylglucosamine transferase
MNERAHASTGRNTVAIVVGSTPGHIHPARAVAEAFARRSPGTCVLIVDAPGGLSARLLPEAGWKRVTIPALPFACVGGGAKLHSMAAALTSLLPARRLLRSNGVRLVLGMGAYVQASVIVAARAAGIATAIHEANVDPGLANRLLAPLADRVYLGHRALCGTWSGRRSLFVGHPVRASIAALAHEPRRAPARDRTARLLVTSNTRGGPFFAHAVPRLAAQVARAGVAVEVLHQCGDDEPGALAQRYRAAGVAARVLPHLDEGDMCRAYRWADFAVAHAGAGTLAELALAGVPALVVPLPGAAWDHQAANARAWDGAGAGLWSREDAAHDDLAARIVALLGDEQAWKVASDKARALVPPDAADQIVADCERLLGGRA